MNFRKGLLFILPVIIFLTGSGCSSFRAFFSDRDAWEKRRASSRKARQKKDKKELQSRRFNRDPVDDMFFNRNEKQVRYWSNDKLTPAERAALQNDLHPERSSRQLVDQIYLENERAKEKRSDWVFPKLFKW